MTPEGEIQSEIMRYLDELGVFHWRNNAGAVKSHGRMIRFGVVGGSDILGVLSDGRALAIEVKTASGKVTPAQESFLSRVRECGGVAFVARSVDDVIRNLGADRKAQT
jgi:hypothetical protein